MSRTLIETSEFPETLTVPVGTDTRGNASSVVAALTQALANRTRFLQTGLAGTAQLAVENIFALANHFRGRVFLDNADATATLLVASAAPAHVSADGASNNTSNKWKPLLAAKTIADNVYARVYSGADGASLGALAIVHNAVWSVGDQNWSHYNSGNPAVGLFWRNDKLRVCVKAAGAASTRWVAWDDGELNAGRVSSSNFGAVTADSFKYTTPKVRTTPLSIATFSGGGFRLADGSVGWVVGADSSGPVAWPILLPRGSIFKGISIRHKQVQDPGQPSDSFELWYRTVGGDWATIKTKTASVSAVSTAHTTILNAPGDGGDTITINDADEFQVVWKVNTTDAAALNANRIISLAYVDRVDNGPA